MNIIKSLNLLTIISTVSGFIFTPLASANETFSICVGNLSQRVYIDTAISDCQDVYRQKLVNETFSTCVENLSKRVYIDTAINGCQKAFSGYYVGETFSTCVENLSKRVYIDTARKTCKTALSNAKGEFRPTQTTGSGTQSPLPVQYGGDPQKIADCMKEVMYARRPVCTRNRCAQLGSPSENANTGFGGWQWQTVRTDISENAAAQACSNAR